MEKTWSRAVWLEGDQEEEGVIPTCWVKNKCVMWPSGISVMKAMREMKLPEENWIKFDLVKIKFTSGKKSECEKYSLTTTAEFSSSEEEMAPRQRKKKRYDDFVTGLDKDQRNCESNGKSRPRAESSAESDNGNEMSGRRLPSPPPVRRSPKKPNGQKQYQPTIRLPPKKQTKATDSRTAVSRPSQQFEDLSSDEDNDHEPIATTPRRSPRKHTSPTQRRQTAVLPPLESDDSERPLGETSPNTPTTSAYPMPTERFQRRVIQLLVEIRDNLRKGNQRQRVEDQEEFEVPECDQIEEFEEFDNCLNDKELQKKMKAKVRLIGGTSLGDHVKNAMKRCMTNGLMAKMNLKGKKGKYAFGNSNICRIIKDGVIQIHPNATESTIFDEMSRFLKYAPGRIGGGGRGKESW